MGSDPNRSRGLAFWDRAPFFLLISWKRDAFKNNIGLPKKAGLNALENEILFKAIGEVLRERLFKSF